MDLTMAQTAGGGQERNELLSGTFPRILGESHFYTVNCYSYLTVHKLSHPIKIQQNVKINMVEFMKIITNDIFSCDFMTLSE